MPEPAPEARRQEPMFRVLASTVDAYHRCRQTKNGEWEVRHRQKIEDLVKSTAPSGAGIDCGTKICLDESTGEKLVFTLSFHHMNDMGMYDGWTEHTVTARPSFIHKVDLKISGRDRNRIKDYLHDAYFTWLTEKTEW